MIVISTDTVVVCITRDCVTDNWYCDKVIFSRESPRTYNRFPVSPRFLYGPPRTAHGRTARAAGLPRAYPRVEAPGARRTAQAAPSRSARRHGASSSACAGHDSRPATEATRPIDVIRHLDNGHYFHRSNGSPRWRRRRPFAMRSPVASGGPHRRTWPATTTDQEYWYAQYDLALTPRG